MPGEPVGTLTFSRSSAGDGVDGDEGDSALEQWMGEHVGRMHTGVSFPADCEMCLASCLVTKPFFSVRSFCSIVVLHIIGRHINNDDRTTVAPPNNRHCAQN